MSEVLQTFASMLFPMGFGAGVQVSPQQGKAKVHGSASKWQTYLSILLWVVELGSLVLAAVFALLLQQDIKLIDDEAITGGDEMAKRLNTNLLLNTIAFMTRAVFVGFVVLVNLSSCTIPAVAGTISSYLFCGDIWNKNRTSKGARNTCLLVWFFLEQVVFLLPLVTMVMLTLGNDIAGVLSKSCLQLGMDECGWECALKYSPFTTFEDTSGNTITRPDTRLYVMAYSLLYCRARKGLSKQHPLPLHQNAPRKQCDFAQLCRNRRQGSRRSHHSDHHRRKQVEGRNYLLLQRRGKEQRRSIEDAIKPYCNKNIMIS